MWGEGSIPETGSGIYEKFKENTQKIFNADADNSQAEQKDTQVR